MAHNPTTWADGFGTWHASVPATTAQRQATAARRAIRAELKERGELLHGFRLHVELERHTGHGTAIYREV